MGSFKKQFGIWAVFAFAFVACSNGTPEGKNTPGDTPGEEEDTQQGGVLITPQPGGGGVAAQLNMGFLAKNYTADIKTAKALGIAKKPRKIKSGTGEAAETIEANYLVKKEDGIKDPIDVVFTREIDGETEETITQEEMPAQVNKLYVFDTYTFIQFVPADTTGIPDLRANAHSTEPDQDGYFWYDKYDYYNDDYHQSFIIENSTGNIYSLGDTVINRIHNGLLELKSNQPGTIIYDYMINPKGELEIFPIFNNPKINVFDYFKDKHGNRYIANDTLQKECRKTTDGCDAENTVFFRNSLTETEFDEQYYLVKNTREVLYANRSLGLFDSWCSEWNEYGPIRRPTYDVPATEIRIMESDLSKRTIDEKDFLEFDSIFGQNPHTKGFIKNKNLFIWRKLSDANLYVFDTDDLRIKHYIEFSKGGFPWDMDEWSNNSEFILVLDSNESDLEKKDLFWYRFDLGSLPQQQYKFSFGFEYNSPLSTYSELKPLVVGLDKKATPFGGWAQTTTGTSVEYTVTLEEDKNGSGKVPTLKTLSTFQAEKQTTIVLQPIR